MTINVSVNGNKLFDWTGDAEDAGKLDEVVREVARNNGVTPEQLGYSTVHYVLKHGGFNPQSDGGEMPILVWALLSRPTEHPDHPGFFRDYVEAWDFDFDISSDDLKKGFRVEVTAEFDGARA